MELTLQWDGGVLENRLILGTRLLNVFAALRSEDIKVYRVPSFGELKRNDVLVFNFPYAENRWDSIRFDVMQYYVKRCIGLPGDTLEIRNGYYKVGDTVYLGDGIVRTYQFKKNYYFVSGDNMLNSQDSRYWGMLPEEYIVGKVTRIWNSKDANTGKIRWERVMKKVD